MFVKFITNAQNLQHASDTATRGLTGLAATSPGLKI